MRRNMKSNSRAPEMNGREKEMVQIVHVHSEP